MSNHTRLRAHIRRLAFELMKAIGIFWIINKTPWLIIKAPWDHLYKKSLIKQTLWYI